MIRPRTIMHATLHGDQNIGSAFPRAVLRAFLRRSQGFPGLLLAVRWFVLSYNINSSSVQTSWPVANISFSRALLATCKAPSICTLVAFLHYSVTILATPVQHNSTLCLCTVYVLYVSDARAMRRTVLYMCLL